MGPSSIEQKESALRPGIVLSPYTKTRDYRGNGTTESLRRYDAHVNGINSYQRIPR